MALTLNTLREIEALLTSDRVTYRGSELRPVMNILAELGREQAEAVRSLRVVPTPAPKAAEE
jgi:hypothetical protein